jgi:hypothetical protein
MNVKYLQQEIVFTTNSYARSNDLKLSAATRQLNRLHKKHSIEKITRGVWANVNHPYFSPLAAVPYLLGKEQGYISFLTALHFYGIISQIPSKIQIATTGRRRKLKSSIGYFEFIHLAPWMMREDIKWSNSKSKYLIALPEKALLDTLYISTRKGNKFSSLPELDLENLNMKRFKYLKGNIKSKKIKIAVEKYITDIYSYK